MRVVRGDSSLAIGKTPPVHPLVTVAAKNSNIPAMACDQWHCTHDTRREPPAKDSPRCRDDHNAYIAAHHAASPCHAYAATRHSPDTPRIDATMAEPVAVFPWLPSSSPHLPLIHSRISGVGLITGELGSPATPKDMPGGVSPRGIRTRARIDGLDPDIDHHCRRALAPCRCHGTFAARGPQRVAGQDISGQPDASGQSSAEIMCFAHNG